MYKDWGILEKCEIEKGWLVLKMLKGVFSLKRGSQILMFLLYFVTFVLLKYCARHTHSNGLKMTIFVVFTSTTGCCRRNMNNSKSL